MQRKVFVAINLGPNNKNYIQKKLAGLRTMIVGKWVPVENYHITLDYVGFIDDQTLAEYCQRLRGSLRGQQGFDLTFDKLCWGPSEQQRKMVWLQGPTSEKLKMLRKKVNAALGKKRGEYQKFKPHITCSRIGKKSLAGSGDKLNLDDHKISLVVPVESVDVMESVFVDGKREYRPLDIIEFN